MVSCLHCNQQGGATAFRTCIINFQLIAKILNILINHILFNILMPFLRLSSVSENEIRI